MPVRYIAAIYRTVILTPSPGGVKQVRPEVTGAACGGVRSVPVQWRAMSTIDYRLARRALLRELQRGRVSRIEVCDAHPELMRAARFIGEEVSEFCPVCERGRLRVVFYTYGGELRGRENGRVRRKQDLIELRSVVGEFVCYVVEVCTECQWNHLIRSFVTGRRHAG